MKIIHYSSVIILGGSLLAGVLVAACDDELIDDATFRLWCGQSLCSWTLDQGHVRPAPTWHKDDLGVELVDTPTRISQPLKNTARCLEFTTVADVSETAQVTVSLDFNGDGVVDYEQRIATTGFHEVKTQVTAPYTNTLPRLFITKKGDGHAVLAQLSLRSGSNCSAPPIRLRDGVLGDACTQGSPSECASGICCEGLCAECCVEPVGKDIGEDGGLADPPIVPCAHGGTCERRDVKQSAFIFSAVPLQCDPGKGLRPSGAVCLSDDDCVSGECAGATSSAIDISGDAAACPRADFPDAGSDACAFKRVHPGQCR